MPSLGNCGTCGGNLAVYGGIIACGECQAPARNHPLMREIAPAKLAEANQKLKEIELQMARLTEQREMWLKTRAEMEEMAGVAAGASPKAVSRPPVAPSMNLPSGAQIIAAEKVQAAGAFERVPTAPLVGGGAKVVSATMPESYCDNGPAEPLLAKAKNEAGAAIVEGRHGKRR